LGGAFISLKKISKKFTKRLAHGYKVGLECIHRAAGVARYLTKKEISNVWKNKSRPLAGYNGPSLFYLQRLAARLGIRFHPFRVGGLRGPSRSFGKRSSAGGEVMTITKQQSNLIKDTARKLCYAIDNRGTSPYVANLIREETKQERQHRNGWCAGRDYPRNFSPTLAAEFFTVSHILGFIFDEVPFPKIESVLFLKKTYVEAAAIAATYPDEIRDVISYATAQEIRAMDYSTLCEVSR